MWQAIINFIITLFLVGLLIIVTRTSIRLLKQIERRLKYEQLKNKLLADIVIFLTLENYRDLVDTEEGIINSYKEELKDEIFVYLRDRYPSLSAKTLSTLLSEMGLI